MQASSTTADGEPSAHPELPGRHADRPAEIPIRGWWRITQRVARRFFAEDLGLIAAGVGFYSLLGLFPAIAALVTTYDLMFDAAQIQAQFEAMRALFPSQVHDLIAARLQSAVDRPDQALGLGLAGAVALSVWGATRGTRALIIALNTAYDEDESRGFFLLNAQAFGLTFFLVLAFAVAIVATVAVPILINLLSFGAVPEVLAAWLRWPLLAAVGLFALAILYRFGPSRRAARWRCSSRC